MMQCNDVILHMLRFAVKYEYFSKGTAVRNQCSLTVIIVSSRTVAQTYSDIVV